MSKKAVTQYEKGIFVMDYLQSIGLNMITIAETVDDKNLEKSYQLIKENPKISKEDFLTQMEIEEYEEMEFSSDSEFRKFLAEQMRIAEEN